MDDSPIMTVNNSLQKLSHKGPYEIFAEGFFEFFEIFFHVKFDEFEDKVEAFLGGLVFDGEEIYDVGVVEFLEDSDFSHGGGGHSFVFVLETDFFDGDGFFSEEIASLVDDTVSTFA